MTSGYGSGSNKSESWWPNQFWAFAKMFFEMEKIDNGNKEDEYNALFLGCKTDGSFRINYKDVNKIVRARAEGYGGAALQQLFEPVLGNENRPNCFYDDENKTFSILTYLSKFRTMDDQGVRLVSTRDNPSGEVVKGSDGKDYVIGTEITTRVFLESYDVCTPSIIVVSLCHNTSIDNYKSNIGRVVSVLRNELPDTKIIIMTIGEAGTLFPEDYPNYIASELVYQELHEKNAKIYNYVKENVEDEENGVYVLATQFVMPTAEGMPTIDKEGINVKNPAVIGQHYHPNNKAHRAMGYALYSMIKYLIS